MSSQAGSEPFDQPAVLVTTIREGSNRSRQAYVAALRCPNPSCSLPEPRRLIRLQQLQHEGNARVCWMCGTVVYDGAWVDCDECSGNGQLFGQDEPAVGEGCPDCGGTGRIPADWQGRSYKQTLTHRTIQQRAALLDGLGDGVPNDEEAQALVRALQALSDALVHVDTANRGEEVVQAYHLAEHAIQTAQYLLRVGWSQRYVGVALPEGAGAGPAPDASQGA